MGSKAIKLSSNESKLAENLGSLLAQSNLSVNQIAQALGIPMMTVRRLLSGETVDPRISTLKLVADYFGVTVDALLQEKQPLPINMAAQSKPIFIPILHWETAEAINSIEQLDLTKWDAWQPISLSEGNTLSKLAFALESRPSMYPRFPQETLFVIDPCVKPIDGDIVLVKIKTDKTLTLRELIIDPPEWHLQPVITGSSTLKYMVKDHQIMGVNVLTMLYNRKIYE